MPSLAELNDPAKLEDFCRQVATRATNQSYVPPKEKQENTIYTTEELTKHLEKGKDVPFDYQLLLDISKDID